MMPGERRSWLIITVIFLTNFFVVGSASCLTGVFLTPLVMHFGWSRTRASSLAMLLALTAAVLGPAMGWLLDRIAAQKVIGLGVAATAMGLLMAGRATAFGEIAVAHMLMGLGMAASTMIPTAVVVSNWFESRRGLALGVAMSGMSLGGSVMASAATYLITRVGWRWAYATLAIPLLLVVLPAVILTVRTRPASAAVSGPVRSDVVDGLDCGEAVRSRSFWLLGFLYFSYLSATNVGVVHMVPYLIGLRFSAQGAAFVFSVALLASTVAKPLMGAMADRLNSRFALAVAVLSLGCGFLMLTQAAHDFAIVPFVLTYSVGVGAPVALVPMVIAESFGLKNFGTLGGLIGIFGMVGSATGPMVAGRMFDVTGAYIPAFLSLAGLLVIAALTPFGCSPFRSKTGDVSHGEKLVASI